MHKNMLYSFLLSSLILIKASVAAVVPPGVELHPTQALTRNNAWEIETLDPALVESVAAHNIARDLFEGLTAINAQGDVVPGVAEKWKQTDPNTWVFYLRHNAKWSNGDPVVADDFVYGWRRYLDPKTASMYASVFNGFILNGKEVTAGKKPLEELGIRALDPYTIEIKTPFPVSFMPDIVSTNNMSPIHRATVEKYGQNWTKAYNIVSNGAFKLKKWHVNSKVMLEKNPHYWDAEHVQLNQVTYLSVEDNSTDVKLFRSGENDMTFEIPPGTYEKFKNEYPKEIKNAPVLGLRYYALNTQDPLLKDVRVRQALSMVIDRDILSKKITADGQSPAYGIIVQGTQGANVTTYDWASWPMAKRVETAKKLLDQAGVSPATPLKILYNTNDYHKKMALFLASEWKTKLGFNTKMENMEFKVLLKRRHDGDFQVARDGWIADYNDATTFLSLVQCHSDQNSNRNCNLKVEELIEKAKYEKNADTRTDLLTQAAKLVMDDYPLIPLLQNTQPRLVKSYVGGYSLKNSMDRYRDKDFYIIKH